VGGLGGKGGWGGGGGGGGKIRGSILGEGEQGGVYDRGKSQVVVEENLHR